MPSTSKRTLGHTRSGSRRTPWRDTHYAATPQNDWQQSTMNERISVIGGGLAGCAAALAAMKHGAAVTLFEQRPATAPTTHQTALLSELAGTADLGVEDLDRATGLLKAELRALCPEMTACVEAARIGEHTVAVDRRAFAQEVTDRVAAAGIELRREELRSLPDGPVVVATGPATWSPLARALAATSGTYFHFSFIGRPPLIEAASLDLTDSFRAPAYPGAEPALYLPVTEEEGAELAARLLAAERCEPPEFGEGILLADEHTTAERMAADPAFGVRKLLSGPRGAQSGGGPALCLTPDDAEERAWHVEGLLTSLPHDEQVRALQAVLACANVRLVRPAMIQRTPFLAGPEAALPSLQLRRAPRALISGTLTGVYGYAEAMVLGAVAGIGAARLAAGDEPAAPPAESLTGALCGALAEAQPHAERRMLRANFGMIPEQREDQGLSKAERRERQTARALAAIESYMTGH